MKLIKIVCENWTPNQLVFAEAFIQVNSSYKYPVMCIIMHKCSNRINEINKILQQKGQAKNNSELQKILSILSDELEVRKTNELISGSVK